MNFARDPESRILLLSALGRMSVPRVRAGLAALMVASFAIAAAPSVASAEAWGFEQVSPAVKGGGTVAGSDTSFQTSADGGSFLYTADTPFDSVPAESVPKYVRYLASRSTDGWLNRALDPSYGVPRPQIYIQGVVGSSDDLSYALVASTRALAPGAIEDGGNLYIRNTRTGALRLVAASPHVELATIMTGALGEARKEFVANDGRSVVFSSAAPSLIPGAPSGALYRWTADGGLSIASALPADQGGGMVSASGTAPGVQTMPRDASPSGDGAARIYFQGFEAGGAGAYVRIGDETRLVSRSRLPGAPSDPVPALVVSVGADGRYALILTAPDFSPDSYRLTEDTPLIEFPSAFVSHIYRYDVVNDSLTYVGSDSDDSFRGPSAAVLGMTEDGQTIAFQSGLALDDGAVPYQPNLYVWRNETTRFVATVDPGAAANLPPLWMHRLSANGRFLAFTDNSASTAARFGADDPDLPCRDFADRNAEVLCSEVYVFDADAAGDGLSCASCRPDSASSKGHAGRPEAQFPGYVRLNTYRERMVSNDGTVFFTSLNDLVREDGNGASDVYAYRSGELRLVSRGTQGTASRFLDATPDGSAIFFATSDPIGPLDKDRSEDVYVTRVGAGFPFDPPVLDVPCGGGDCRGPKGPGSSAPGNPGSSSPSVPGGPADERPTRARVRLVRSRLKGNTLRVTARASTGGRIRVSGRGLKTTMRTVSRAGTYVIKARVASSLKKKLATNRRVRVRTRVSLAPPFGRAAVVHSNRTVRK